MSMANKYNEEHQRLARTKVIETAHRILSGKLGIVAGARQLSALRFDVGAENDPDFIFFVGVDSETDHLPIGDARSRWNPDVLKAKDLELHAYEASVRDEAHRICQSLIQKYEIHDA